MNSPTSPPRAFGDSTLVLMVLLSAFGAIIGIVLRVLALRIWGGKIRNGLEVFAAGKIACDALFRFFNSTIQYRAKVK